VVAGGIRRKLAGLLGISASREAEPVAPPAAAGQSSDDVDALLSAAGASAAQGDVDQAIATYTRVIAHKPDQALAYYKRGNLLKDREQMEAALADYERAIACDPAHDCALGNRGFVLTALGRLEAALASYDRALAVIPTDVVYLFGRANVLRQLDRFEEALAGYGRTIENDPKHVPSYCNRGALLTDLLRYTEARADFDRAIGLGADIPEIWYGRGRVLHRLQFCEEALADYRRASDLNPKFVDAFFAQGEALRALNRLEESLSSYDRVIALQPGHAFASRCRGEVLWTLGRPVDSIAAYRRAVDCDPNVPGGAGMLQFTRMYICDWEEWDADVEPLVARLRSGALVSTPFAALAFTDDPAAQYEAARGWLNDELPARSDLPPIRRTPAADKIRVAYVSSDFSETHPVGILTTQLFENHDRQRFEITAYSVGKVKTDPARRLEKAFDRFLDVRAKTDRELAVLMREQGIDIAVDLSGHTAGGRLGLFAQRAAPIQATYLGYAGTTGADFFDYLIADQNVIPEENQRYFSEKIVYLPHCYLPNDSTRVIGPAPSREQMGLPAEGFVFCSFNNSYKFTPDVFSIWMRILQRVERSVLWMPFNNANAAANLRKEAQRRGIDAERVIFAGHLPLLSQHLGRLQLADLMLDTLPYNAHSTAIDALLAGVPVLTRIGNSFAGRVAASLLRTIGLPELVTGSPQEYEEMAVALATSPARLAALKQRLSSNRLTRPPFDPESSVRQLEAAYEKMYERYHAQLPPDHIHVP
jgi:protein O-GlcNAc transferase